METTHVGTIAVLLEEDVPLPVRICHAMALVGPGVAGHAMELGTMDLVGPIIGGIRELGSLGGQLGIVVRSHFVGAPRSIIYINVIYDSVDGVEQELVLSDVVGVLAHEEGCRAAGDGCIACRGARSDLLTVEVKRHAATSAGRDGNGGDEVVPLVFGQCTRAIDDDDRIVDVALELIVATVADIEGHARLGTFVDVASQAGVFLPVDVDIHHGIGLESCP